MENLLKEIPNLDEKELVLLNGYIISQLKRVRAAKSRAMKMSLNKGDTVKWIGRNGPTSGTVTEIKRKYAHVDVANPSGGTGIWRVPMNMLHKV